MANRDQIKLSNCFPNDYTKPGLFVDAPQADSLYYDRMSLPYDRDALRGRVAVVAGATRGADRGIAAALGAVHFRDKARQRWGGYLFCTGTNLGNQK